MCIPSNGAEARCSQVGLSQAQVSRGSRWLTEGGLQSRFTVRPLALFRSEHNTRFQACRSSELCRDDDTLSDDRKIDHLRLVYGVIMIIGTALVRRRTETSKSPNALLAYLSYQQT